ncbi:related to DUF887 domain protein [Rhynchosporium agropyri]|uniref:Related to DUF887 domain protein n=1 Tax=Rhynchosporium agropyri TaxID=914238 RepID=A0A1E1JUX0_9HELO|nr:related to DUF887 domain protein [Rhynchosporium agropyri]
MLDIFQPAPFYLVRAIKPLADFLSLWTLPYHIHEVIAALVSYQLIFSVLSPLASSWIAPKTYRGLPPRRRISWNVHVTSMVQSTLITTLALYVIWNDEERKNMEWVGRIWGYTGAMGLVQGLAAGYFLWDLIASIIHFNVLGPGSLAHAISALLVTSSVCIYRDVWTALQTPTIDLKYASDSSIFDYMMATGLNGVSYSHNMQLPLWLVIVYLGSNTLLNFFNVYWFSQMVQAMRKRFQPPNPAKDR